MKKNFLFSRYASLIKIILMRSKLDKKLRSQIFPAMSIQYKNYKHHPRSKRKHFFVSY